MRIPTCLTPLTLLLWAAACGSDKPAEGQWPLSRDQLARGAHPQAPGAATYRQYCVGCHGVDGRGQGGTTGANFLAAASPLLTKTDAELLMSVRDGKRGTTATMPPHRPVLTDAQIAEVIAYVRAQFTPPPAATR